MMFTTLRRWAAPALLAIVAAAPAALAGDDPSAYAPPQPGPMHKRLAEGVGTWKATAKMYMVPGQPPSLMEGIEENRAIVGGRWFVTSFKSDTPSPFEGHGTFGWDEKKGKTVGTWVDTWALGVSTFEGSYSEDGKTCTSLMVGPGMTGELETSTMVETFHDANHRSWKMYKGPDSSGSPSMEMEYVRVTSPAKGAKSNKH